MIQVKKSVKTPIELFSVLFNPYNWLNERKKHRICVPNPKCCGLCITNHIINAKKKERKMLEGNKVHRNCRSKN